jgi:FKBP-type peptidyl-prolyl cis-trans isomerase
MKHLHHNHHQHHQHQQQQQQHPKTLQGGDGASTTTTQQTSSSSSSNTRRDFFSKIGGAATAAAAVTAVTAAGTPFVNPSPAIAAAMTTTKTSTTPQIYNLPSGIKYAVLNDATNNAKGGGSYPQQGDIVAIEYTGYLTNGQIFDASHSGNGGKSNNALLFQLGSTAVIPGINEMVSEMKVGQKVQAIIPPALAFGDKGICVQQGNGDDGEKKQSGGSGGSISSISSEVECLVKPGSTLVYDIYLKKASIPPP